MPLPPPNFQFHTFKHPHEQKQFDFFNQLNHPHHGLVAMVEVGKLRAFAKTNGQSFTRVVVHALASAANRVPALRRRVRGNEVIEHKAVHPSYTVTTAVSEGFSFCTIPYQSDFLAFAKTAQETEAAMRLDPSFSDEPGRDDYLFLSAIPWVHFTGIQHAMGYHPTDSVPRISWGKIKEETSLTGKVSLLMPVSIQVHHAVADGKALGDFYGAVDAFMAEL